MLYQIMIRPWDVNGVENFTLAQKYSTDHTFWPSHGVNDKGVRDFDRLTILVLLNLFKKLKEVTYFWPL